MKNRVDTTPIHSDYSNQPILYTYTYIDAYELNLVLRNRRVNIVAHSDYKSMKKDARKLARLLNVSVEESKR